jgi:hypothetical protein
MPPARPGSESACRTNPGSLGARAASQDRRSMAAAGGTRSGEETARGPEADSRQAGYGYVSQRRRSIRRCRPVADHPVQRRVEILRRTHKNARQSVERQRAVFFDQRNPSIFAPELHIVAALPVRIKANFQRVKRDPLSRQQRRPRERMKLLSISRAGKGLFRQRRTGSGQQKRNEHPQY